MSDMKILAPVNEACEAQKVIDAGADEIYCGVAPQPSAGSARGAGFSVSINKRPAKGNLKSYAELREVVGVAHRHSVTVALTVNANSYTQKLYPELRRQVEEAGKAGVDALIVTDIGLLLVLKKEIKGFEIHMGTASAAFNSQAVRFYEDLGASRIVLPRDVKLEEAEEVIRDCPGVKFEAIILRSGCRYTDGMCWLSHHLNETFGRSRFARGLKYKARVFLSSLMEALPNRAAQKLKGLSSFCFPCACILDYRLSSVGSRKMERAAQENISAAFAPFSLADACGVCKLRAFEKMGLYGVKIAGRGYSAKQKTDDVRFVKTLLSSRDVLPAHFQDRVHQAHREIYGGACKGPCYYP